jgi:two-component system, LytTR family, response regulator
MNLPTRPWRCLVVDDEALGRSNLRHALAEHAGWQLVAECDGVPAALAALTGAAREQAIDLLFLDIQMPGENGIALARRLSEWAEPPVIVFVTAYERYAVEAFAVHALDYLLKPFDDARFAHALDRAQALMRLRQPGSYAEMLRGGVAELDRPAPLPPLQSLNVRSLGRIERVPLDQVRWIAAGGNYVELHLGTRSVLHRMPLSQLEQRLDPAIWLRVHRCALVRRSLCASLKVLGDGVYQLGLSGGEQVAVSERHVQGVRAQLGAA